MTAPHFDPKKVLALFTHKESKIFRKALKQHNGPKVRAMTVKALQRAAHLPLSAFMKTEREKIFVSGAQEAK